MKLGTIMTALCVLTPLSAQAQTSAPPIPRPAAGAVPQNTATAIQKSFRTQTPAEQQASAQTAPMDVTPSGHARNPR
jgi:hypothetical protein